jgi:hypothetical protein
MLEQDITPYDVAAAHVARDGATVRVAGLAGDYNVADILVRTLGEDVATELCLRDLMERVA